MPWPQTGTTHYHAKLELPGKDRAIIGLIVCYIVARIYDLWDGSLDKRKVRGSGSFVGSGWL